MVLDGCKPEDAWVLRSWPCDNDNLSDFVAFEYQIISVTWTPEGVVVLFSAAVVSCDGNSETVE